MPKLHFFVPSGQSVTDRSLAENSVRDLGLKVAAGVAAIVAGLLTFRKYELSKRDQVARERAAADERFSKALSQLGDPSVAIRLGGVYILTRIAIESQGYSLAVHEVLEMYCRVESERLRLSSAGARPEDILAAVTFLASQAVEDVSVPGLFAPGLTLRDATLVNWDLGGAHLRNAVLKDTVLRGTNLAGVDFTSARMTHVEANESDFGGSNLRLSHVVTSSFHGSDFTGVKFSHSTVRASDFSGATLSRTDWTMATIHECDFRLARLSQVAFIGTSIEFVNFEGVRADAVRLTACTVKGEGTKAALESLGDSLATSAS
jgi:uncharacterized protein YjbI with pentapeptide repeats